MEMMGGGPNPVKNCEVHHQQQQQQGGHREEIMDTIHPSIHHQWMVNCVRNGNNEEKLRTLEVDDCVSIKKRNKRLQNNGLIMCDSAGWINDQKLLIVIKQ